LTAKPSHLKRFILTGLIFVIVVSAILYILLTADRSGKGKRKDEMVSRAEIEKEEEQPEAENLVLFEEEEIIRDFMSGDVIEIPVKNTIHRISIDGIDENLEFSIENIPFSLSTDERVEIDFDRDGRKDLMLRTNRMGEGSVNLTLKKIFKTESSDLSIGLATEETEGSSGTAPSSAETPGGPPEVVIIKEDELFADIPVAPTGGFQIISGYEKTDINTAVKAVSTAYFAYVIYEGDKQEFLLRNGDELTFTAEDVIRIMAANARGINVQVNDVPVTLGKGGEVVAKVVRWYRDSDDSDLYHLIMDDWEK
jgi:hypothetical protein